MSGSTKKVKARDEFVLFTEKTRHLKLGALSKKQQSLSIDPVLREGNTQQTQTEDFR
jgi:hypothetical protein